MPFIRDAKSLIGEVHDGVVIVSSFTRQLEDFPALKDIGRHIVEYMQVHLFGPFIGTDLWFRAYFNDNDFVIQHKTYSNQKKQEALLVTLLNQSRFIEPQNKQETAIKIAGEMPK